MTAIASLSAAELGPLYAAPASSRPSRSPMDALARIERFEPAINAFVVRDEAITLRHGASGRERAG